MKRWGSILLFLVGALAFSAFSIGYVIPVGSSIYGAHKTASQVPYVNQVPVALKDLSTSQGAGAELSYLGLQFEVPWTDLDQAKTKQIPGMAVLNFHSGLVLSIVSGPPEENQRMFAEHWQITAKQFEVMWGHGAARSDYDFTRAVYSVTPDKLYGLFLPWSLRYRDDLLLAFKIAALKNLADSGIFEINGDSHRGFQLGDPQVRPAVMEVQLFSNQGDISITFYQQKFSQTAGVSQADINRIVKSLRKL